MILAIVRNHKSNLPIRRMTCISRCARAVSTVLLFAAITTPAVRGQGTQPIVAIHDSELTRALDDPSAVAVSPTPSGPGTTGLQWWPTKWHYFVMPESV